MGVENFYELGKGIGAIGVSTVKGTDVVLITLSDLLEKTEVGVDLLGKDVEEENITILFIHNLEGLAVLEDACKNARTILESKK